MLVFVQPYGLNSPGGGARIFRSLLQDAPVPFLSICTSPQSPPQTTIGKEIHLPIRPHLGRLESTRLSRYFYPIEAGLAQRFEDRFAQICLEHKATGIHGLAHSLDFWYAYRVAQKLNLPYYLTVHDELTYNLHKRLELGTAMNRLAKVWAGATARFVISDVMGQEYCRRYGDRSYAVVTDGLEKVAPAPLVRSPKSLRVYFMGSVHLSYQANFCALVQALDQFQQTHLDWTVSLSIRGGLSFSLPENAIAIKLLPWASEAEVAADINHADVLYLPLPFGKSNESFARYSLSTKLVTYLGSGLPILYHGPKFAAAAQLLREKDAAILAESLDPEDIQQVLANAKSRTSEMVENALHLGCNQFSLNNTQNRFWKTLQHNGDLPVSCEIGRC